jgi:hypothetical protein
MNIFASVLDFRAVMSPTEKQNHDVSLRLRLTYFRKFVTIDKIGEKETALSSVNPAKNEELDDRNEQFSTFYPMMLT